MRIGSGLFVGLLVLIALGAATGGVALDSRPLLWCAVVVGAYAIHLMAMREATTSENRISPRAAVRSEQSALDEERAEVERLRRELERKLAQAEEQWTLLRAMVRERLRRSGSSGSAQPDSEVEADEDISGQTNPTRNSAPVSDDTGRAYSRW
jgi:hypothetical protein